MTNCDVSVTSYLNFVTDTPKIRPFSVLLHAILVKVPYEYVAMEGLSFQFWLLKSPMYF